MKCVWGINECVLPPNLNFEKPNKGIPGLLDGRLKVITELTPWSGEYAAISGFGIGGTNSHVIVKKNDQPNTSEHPANEAVRLFTYGARTYEGLRKVFDEVQKNPQDVYVQALLQSSANEPVQKMPYRGFTILNSETNTIDIKPATKRPVVFVCAG